MTQPEYEVETNPGTTAILQPPRPPMPPGYDAAGRPSGGGPERDRLWVHLIWEAVLTAATVLTFVVAASSHDEFTQATTLRRLALAVAVTGLLATGFSFSLRAAVPNLAVGSLGVFAGLEVARLARQDGWSTGAAVAVVLLGAAAVGFALALFVGLLNVPSWAASLGVAGLLIGAGVPMISESARGNVRPPHVDVLGSAWLWAALFVVISVLGGGLWLVPGVRRGLSGFRHGGDPGRRPPVGGVFGALLALVVSSVLAAASGVLMALEEGSTYVAQYSVVNGAYVLAIVLVGGVSVFGRRSGVFGTVVATVLFAIITQWLVAADRGPGAWYVVVGVGVLLGLVITRLLEFAGRRR